jgi:hypothetical protein
MRSTPVTLTIRVSQEHQDALDKLPSPLTASTLVRTLLQEYLQGNLPEWVDARILEEAGLAVAARRKVLFKPGQKPWNSAGVKPKCQIKNPVPPILRLNLKAQKS